MYSGGLLVIPTSPANIRDSMSMYVAKHYQQLSTAPLYKYKQPYTNLDTERWHLEIIQSNKV